MACDERISTPIAENPLIAGVGMRQSYGCWRHLAIKSISIRLDLALEMLAMPTLLARGPRVRASGGEPSSFGILTQCHQGTSVWSAGLYFKPLKSWDLIRCRSAAA